MITFSSQLLSVSIYREQNKRSKVWYERVSLLGENKDTIILKIIIHAKLMNHTRVYVLIQELGLHGRTFVSFMNFSIFRRDGNRGWEM